jgi:hypothetical protein
MEFLQGNWFSILTVLVIVGGWFATRAKRDEKMDQVIKTVDGLDEMLDKLVISFDEHVDTYNKHVADADLHVNRNLRELLDTRFRELHTSVGLIQKTLDKM